MLKSHMESAGGFHCAPESKLPPQVRLAVKTDEDRLKLQGQFSSVVMPSTVPGQTSCMLRSGSLSGEGRSVTSAEHRSKKYTIITKAYKHIMS